MLLERLRKALEVAAGFQWRRTMQWLWGDKPSSVLLSGSLIAALGALPLLELYLIKRTIDAVAHSVGTPAERLGELLLWVACAAGLAAFKAAGNAMATIAREAQADVAQERVFALVHRKSAEVDLDYYENAKYHDVLHRAQSDVPTRPAQFVRALTDLLQSGVAAAAVMLLVLFVDWRLAAAAIASGLIGLAVHLRHTHCLHDWERQRTPAERRSIYFSWLLTREPFAKEVRLFDLGELFQRRFQMTRGELRKERRQLNARATRAELTVQVVNVGALFAVLAVLGRDAVYGATSFGQMVMYFQAYTRGQDYMARTFKAVGSVYENALYLRSLYAFLDLPSKESLERSAATVPVPTPITHGIDFRDIHFSYPGATHPVLRSLNLTIRAGEHVAIVGENGAAKSTLIKLLCRLYEPTSGTIAIDGVDIRHINRAELRKSICVVLQDYCRYQFSVADNIGVAAQCEAEFALIEQAARQAGAHEAIIRLRKGYETMLGQAVGDGQGLSGGEWQKLALARAFLVQNAQVLVLDEPSSSLDPRSEHELFENFRQLAQGRIAILISHRLSSVKWADRIYMLHQGHLVECGTHQELIQQGGAYADMYELQAKQYL